MRTTPSATPASLAPPQRVEHYEIAGYGTVRSLAETLGHDEIADLLGQTLREEKETDDKLTELATTSVTPEAQHAGREES